MIAGNDLVLLLNLGTRQAQSFIRKSSADTAEPVILLLVHARVTQVSPVARATAPTAPALALARVAALRSASLRGHSPSHMAAGRRNDCKYASATADTQALIVLYASVPQETIRKQHAVMQ